MAKEKSNKENSDIFIKTLDAIFPDIVKKALFISIGGVLFTEEAIRKLLADLKLPKDMISYIIQQSNRSKNELLRILAEEIRKVLTQIRIDEEIKNILQGFSIQVKMEVSFEPKPGHPASTAEEVIAQTIKKTTKSKQKKSGKTTTGK